MSKYGIGIIGAGPGVSALHLPTLARMRDTFRVVHVADGGSGRAGKLAARIGARSSSGIDTLLADPKVDVVALCTAAEQHPPQLLACIDAGKRGIFCEKPLAITTPDAHAILDALTANDVSVLVGTNHLYDSAWATARRELTGAHIRSVNVTASMPSNARYHSVVHDADAGIARPFLKLDVRDSEQAARLASGLMIGLAVHDLPLIRQLAPQFQCVDFAAVVEPVGYLVGFTASDVQVRLAAVMVPDGADTSWVLRVDADDRVVEIDFPPPFVHAGSATVRVHHTSGRSAEYRREAEDSFVAEWMAFAARLEGRAVTPYQDILDDALYTIEVSEAVGAHMRRTQ